MSNIISIDRPRNSDDSKAWLVAEGDSMKGEFNSGDPLLVDIQVKHFEGDALYVFQMDDARFIKRLQRIPDKGLAVISSNPNYETWYMTPDMNYQIIGRVVKAYKSDKL